MKFALIKPSLVLAVIALATTGCKGRAQRVGEGIDNAVDTVRDAVTQPGPLEKGGRAIDRAVAK